MGLVSILGKSGALAGMKKGAALADGKPLEAHAQVQARGGSRWDTSSLINLLTRD